MCKQDQTNKQKCPLKEGVGNLISRKQNIPMEHFPASLFKPTISWDIQLHVLCAPWSLSIGLVITYNSDSKHLDATSYSISEDLGWPAQNLKEPKLQPSWTPVHRACHLLFQINKNQEGMLSFSFRLREEVHLGVGMWSVDRRRAERIELHQGSNSKPVEGEITLALSAPKLP